MAEPYGVLGGMDSASLIQRQDDGTWKAVARGKLEDLRGIASVLNEAALVRDLGNGSNDVAVIPPEAWETVRPPSAAVQMAQDEAAMAEMSMLERNRAAIENELGALPIDWNVRGGNITFPELYTLNAEALATLRGRIWAHGTAHTDGKDGRLYDFDAARYVTAKPDPADFLPVPANGRTSINWNDLRSLQHTHPEVLDELSARRWQEGDRQRDGKDGRFYTAQASIYLDAKAWQK